MTKSIQWFALLVHYTTLQQQANSKVKLCMLLFLNAVVQGASETSSKMQ